MYEKILVAIDESPVAEQVLAAARELARLSGGEVRALHLRERCRGHRHGLPGPWRSCRAGAGQHGA
jgi:nucleotide-binding universal stress UspA family protein